MKLIVMISSYREGGLLASVVASARDAEPDGIVVWEGPAGPNRLPDAPASPDLQTLAPLVYRNSEQGWGGDAAKRTEMVKAAKQAWPNEPLWGLWLDADEILLNGRYLRDQCQAILWEDERRGASIATPDNPPTGGIPIRLVEPDGSVSRMLGRLIRVDLISKYLVSNLIVEMIGGIELRLGNFVESMEEWVAPRMEAAPGRLFLLPPLPGEPHLVHRSHLRHPARRGLRLHEQEADELKRLGLPGGKE